MAKNWMGRIKQTSILALLTSSIFSASPVFAEKLTINAREIPFSSPQPDRQKFGKLLWRGALVLRSSHKRFGGISGLELSKDGKKFIAISDRGYFLRGDIEYDGIKPTGFKNAEITPILNMKGKKFKHWKSDAEGLTKRNDSINDVIISVERDQAMYRFKFGKSFKAPALDQGDLSSVKNIGGNRGLEALTSLPKNHKYRGWLLAIAEKKLNKKGDHTGWLVQGKKIQALNITRSKGYDITDATYLPNGDIVILERALSMITGPQMRIRQFCGSDIKPGAYLSGTELLDVNGFYAIDNMEGIASHIDENGRTVLSIIADNNFHFLERNIFLQFGLVSEKSICE